LSQRLGQPILCENRTGAAGSIAAEAVAYMTPDGYALLLATIATQSVNRHLYARLPYDPERDFTPISHLWNAVNVMAVSTDSSWMDVQALIYECATDASGTNRRRFREPIAALLVSGRTIGRHFAGPSWQLTDGSLAAGRVAGARQPKGPGECLPTEPGRYRFGKAPWLQVGPTAGGGGMRSIRCLMEPPEASGCCPGIMCVES